MEDDIVVVGTYPYPWESEDTRTYGSSEEPPVMMYTVPFSSIPIGAYMRGPTYRVAIPKSRRLKHE
jgi:hypothetical protein